MLHRLAPNTVLALLPALICCLWATAVHAQLQPLSATDVETTLAIRERADGLRIEALTAASRQKSGDESFADTLAVVQRIGDEADSRACAERGVAVEQYRGCLRRLIAVGELVFFEEMRDAMEAELRQRMAKSDAALAREAEATRASTEQWYEEISNPAPGGSEGEPAKPAPPAGYTDSLEQLVVEPVRRRAADGTLVDTVRQANEKRIAEIRQRLEEIDRQTAAPALRQAAADKPVVLPLVDRETLQGLSASLAEEIPLTAPR